MLKLRPSVSEMTVIVPVGTAHVGCNVAISFGANKGKDGAFTVTDVPSEMHVVSVADLAVTMYSPGGTSVKMPFELV